jgi:MinD-like ATPase involved in chromosome partitioning or flagellar assembly
VAESKKPNPAAQGRPTAPNKKPTPAKARTTAPKPTPARVEQAPEVLLLDEIKDSLFAPATGLTIDTVSITVDKVNTQEIVIPVTTGETPAIAANLDESEGDETVSEAIDDQVGALPTRRSRAAGEVSNIPEPVGMLTPDRILELPKQRIVPEGGLRPLLYHATFGLVDLGDSPSVRHRKAIDAIIGRHLDGHTKFVPVLTRKGGVGKTTVTTMLGMALARVREDRVVCIDANPDRGTLAERFHRTTDRTIRDLVIKAPSIRSYADFSEFVTRDSNRLDVIASDTDPLLSEAFGEADYNVVADFVSRYYSIALTDCGTGIVHSVMKPTLERASSLVIVSGGSFDEARLAAETLTWLESNGYKNLVRNAVVALNTAIQGTQLVKVDEIEAHFRSRVRAIVRIPYDPLLAAGSFIDFDRLRPMTQEAARELA